MKHSTTFTIGTFLSLATALFSFWFFPFQGVTLAGLIIGTGFVALAGMSITITNILIKEGN
jgi:hypothetical protein